MPKRANFQNILSEMEPYIKNSAKHASEILMQYNIVQEPFKGTSLTMTPDICEMYYRDMIWRILNNEITMGIHGGLSVAAVPVKNLPGGDVLYSLQLGICFPPMSQS